MGTIASALAAARRQAGKTQEEIARAVGLTRGQVGHVERGRSETTTSAAEAWLDACNHVLEVRPRSAATVQVLTTPEGVDALHAMEALPPDVLRELVRFARIAHELAPQTRDPAVGLLKLISDQAAASHVENSGPGAA